jgi:hypothetical protein
LPAFLATLSEKSVQAENRLKAIFENNKFTDNQI